MDFSHKTASPSTYAAITADALLLIVSAEGAGPELDPRLLAMFNDAVSQGDLQLKAGKVLYLHRPAGLAVPRLVYSVAGASNAKAFRAALVAGLAALKGCGARHLAVGVGNGELTAAMAEALVGAVADATYLYRHTKPSATDVSPLAMVTLLCGKDDGKAVQLGLQRGRAIASGVKLARECANLPGNHCTPTYLAEQAQKIGKDHDLKVQVLDRKDVEKLGMGSFLAVAQGSDEPLRFIVARYQGAAKTQAPVVLVGKGITFDTGGISIKPSSEMDEMKFDMGGAASVLGTLLAIAELKPKLNLVCIIPSCENMPSGRAVKPGDVVTSMSGQTIEVLNTDAEGRLVLADALAYADLDLQADVIVDVATLTGAMPVALGKRHAGMFASDEALAGQLEAASSSSGERLWRMPLVEDYRHALDSPIADLRNIGQPKLKLMGGSITAALFLREFTGGRPWAHLDIAGTALSADDRRRLKHPLTGGLILFGRNWESRRQLAKGGTGFGVRLLTAWLTALAAAPAPKRATGVRARTATRRSA